VLIKVYPAVCLWKTFFLCQGVPITKIVFPPSQSLRLDLLNIPPSLWPCKKTIASKISWPWAVDHYQHFHSFHQLCGYKEATGFSETAIPNYRNTALWTGCAFKECNLHTAAVRAYRAAIFCVSNTFVQLEIICRNYLVNSLIIIWQFLSAWSVLKKAFVSFIRLLWLLKIVSARERKD
jgi:hypothetical protein